MDHFIMSVLMIEEALQRGIVHLSMHVYHFVYFYRLRFSDLLECNEGQFSKNLSVQQENHI